jgi:hypothetical protein
LIEYKWIGTEREIQSSSIWNEYVKRLKQVEFILQSYKGRSGFNNSK